MRQVTADLQPTALDGFVATPSIRKFAPFMTARADRRRAIAAPSTASPALGVSWTTT
jgi:hypothetical protein